MATQNVTVNLANNTAYSSETWVYAAVGDTVVATINGVNNKHWGEVTGLQINGSPSNGATGSTWSYTVQPADADSDNTVQAHFFSPYSPVDGTGATHSGKLKINVVSPVFNSVSYDSTVASGTVNVTLSVTDTRNSSHTSHSSTSLLIRALPSTTYVNTDSNGGNFTYAQPRGETWTYHTRIWTPGAIVFNGVANKGDTPSGTYGEQKTVALGYLAADLAISNGGNITTANGLWTQTISGQGSNSNYVVARLVGGQHIMLGKANNTKLDSGVNGTSLVNDKADNSPSAGNTDTYYIYGSRTSTSGGSGGQGIWDPGEAYPGTSSGWGICTSGQSFTVTRQESFNEACSNATGTYFDTDTDTGSKHRVSFTGLHASYYYNISRSGSSSTFTSAGNWFIDSDGSATRTPEDPAMTDPGGTASTQKTYHLWRSSSSNGASPTYTNVSYTRTIVSDERLVINDTPVAVGASAYVAEIANTIVGHTYYIINSSSSGGTTVGSATATGTTTSITVTSGLPTDSLGESAVLYLWHSAPLNAPTTTAVYADESFTVTRTGTGTGSGLGTANDYGMKIFSTTGATLIDTQSRLGKVVTSGTIPTSGTLAASAAQDVSVTGLANSTLWNVIVVPTTGGTSTSSFGYQFTVVKSGGKFTLTNTSSTANSYKYYVVKTGS